MPSCAAPRCDRPIPDVAYVAYERLVVRVASGCWSWRGPINNSGYARVGKHYAHRISYQIHRGPIPLGLLVMHSCDNPPCTNPLHLSLGTQHDNMGDAAAKGRLDGRANRPKGEANKSSKLTADQVRAIRALRAAGVPRPEVAQRFGVCRQRISDITTRKAWRHV